VCGTRNPRLPMYRLNRRRQGPLECLPLTRVCWCRTNRERLARLHVTSDCSRDGDGLVARNFLRQLRAEYCLATLLYSIMCLPLRDLEKGCYCQTAKAFRIQPLSSDNKTVSD
jgi:hypothetical protein